MWTGEPSGFFAGEMVNPHRMREMARNRFLSATWNPGQTPRAKGKMNPLLRVLIDCVVLCQCVFSSLSHWVKVSWVSEPLVVQGPDLFGMNPISSYYTQSWSRGGYLHSSSPWILSVWSFHYKRHPPWLREERQHLEGSAPLVRLVIDESLC